MQFCGWMCAGCVAGALAFPLHLRVFWDVTDAQAPGITDRQKLRLSASYFQHLAAHNFFFPLESLCVICAMSLLLRRVSDHASHSYYNSARDHDGDGSKRFDCRDCVGQYALYYLVRSLHVVAMLLSASNTIVRFVQVAFAAESASFYYQAADFCDAEGKLTDNSNVIINDLVMPSIKRYFRAYSASRTVQTAVVLLIAFEFLLYFPAVIVMFRRVERRLDAAVQEMDLRPDYGSVFLPLEFSNSVREISDLTAAGGAGAASSQIKMDAGQARFFLGSIKAAAASQRMQFASCLIFVLLALFVMASFLLFQVLYAVGELYQNPACRVCGLCQSIEFLMSQWYSYTPELFPLITSLSSTLPLLFSLWLMTTKEDRLLLLRPSLFLTEQVQRDTEARLKNERIRMGIELVS